MADRAWGSLPRYLRARKRRKTLRRVTVAGRVYLVRPPSPRKRRR